jgi:LmbE family N-acetylglucosaminyl deacetylase
MKRITRLFVALLALAMLTLTGCGSSDTFVVEPLKVLLITAHPDDETMFNLGRFRERGWQVSIALVTNGENGSVVQGIRQDYDPKKDEDILIELDAGPGAWLTIPPDGPRLKEVTTHPDLARQRRQEFLASCSKHGVSTVYFLSDLERADFEDSWDNGVINWNQTLLTARLTDAVNRSRPDLIITLNPDETWAHRQHFGLARIVKTLWQAGSFDLPGALRPTLYGIREHGWYQQSWTPQSGDLQFERSSFSSVLGMSYESYWREATSFYISQSSHPVWFDARVGVNILPGYRGTDMIRRLDTMTGREGLDQLFSRFPSDPLRAALLPTTPVVVNLAGG